MKKMMFYRVDILSKVKFDDKEMRFIVPVPVIAKVSDGRVEVSNYWNFMGEFEKENGKVSRESIDELIKAIWTKLMQKDFLKYMRKIFRRKVYETMRIESVNIVFLGEKDVGGDNRNVVGKEDEIKVSKRK